MVSCGAIGSPMSKSPSPTVPPIASSRKTDSGLESFSLDDAISSDWIEQVPPSIIPTDVQQYMSCAEVLEITTLFVFNTGHFFFNSEITVGRKSVFIFIV